MSTPVEVDHDGGVIGLDGGRHVDEVSEDLPSLSVGVTAHSTGQEPVEPAAMTSRAGRSEKPDGELGGSRKMRLAHEQGEVHPLRYSLAAFFLGQAVVGASFLLPDSELNLWLAILGGTLSLTGLGMLLRHWERARDAVLEAFRLGRGIHFLRTQASRCVQAARRAFAAAPSRVSARRTQTAKLPAPPGAIPEEPTPPVKKAA